jgi:hypothetical protein
VYIRMCNFCVFVCLYMCICMCICIYICDIIRLYMACRTDGRHYTLDAAMVIVIVYLYYWIMEQTLMIRIMLAYMLMLTCVFVSNFMLTILHVDWVVAIAHRMH